MKKRRRRIHYKNYRIGNTLGSGAFATVKLATRRSTGEMFAMKIVEKKKFRDDREFGGSSKNSESEKIMREVDILQQCDHPNITKCYNVFDTPKRLYILLELVKGGELFDRLVDRGAFSNRKLDDLDSSLEVIDIYTVEMLISSMTSSRRTYYSKRMACRSRSVILECPDSRAGKFHENNCGYSSIRRTRGLDGHGRRAVRVTAKEADLWSLGAVLYVLLSARMPFGDASRAGSVFEQVKRCEYSFPSQVFGNISDEAIDLIRKLLVKDPRNV